MPLKPAGERLILLGLSIEDALRRESWQELNALLEAREREITRLEIQGVRMDSATGAALAEIDARIVSVLGSWREHYSRQIASLVPARGAARAYRSKARHESYDSLT